MEKKKKKISAPIVVAIVLCLALLGFSAWQLAGIFMEYKRGTDEYDSLREYVKDQLPDMEFGEEEAPPETTESRIDFAELKALNEDVIGWIEIPGTEINYPIVHGDDDAYYLNHTFNDNLNSAGAIFIETLNSPDFTDLHTIIYGHNMKNGSMFGSLTEYKSASYMVEHPLIFIDLEDGSSHAYRIFSCYETDPLSDSYTIGFQRDEMYTNFLKKLKDRSEYDMDVDVTVDDSIITLSTCTKTGEDRFVVHAKLAW